MFKHGNRDSRKNFLTPRTFERVEPMVSEPIKAYQTANTIGYVSGLLVAKDHIIERKPDVVLFPLRGAWPFAKVIQLSASLENSSSKLPVFKYPPFSSHYFTKHRSEQSDIRDTTVSGYLDGLHLFLKKTAVGKPKIMVVDEVLSGSSLTGTHLALTSSLDRKYGKGNYELTIIAMCDRSHIQFVSSVKPKADQIVDLVKKGEIVFINQELNKKIMGGSIRPKELEITDEFSSNAFVFLGADMRSMVASGEVTFKNDQFNKLVREGKILPIAVGSLFTTDSKTFLYDLRKTMRQGSTMPSYNSLSFDQRVFRNMQVLLQNAQNLMSTE